MGQVEPLTHQVISVTMDTEGYPYRCFATFIEGNEFNFILVAERGNKFPNGVAKSLNDVSHPYEYIKQRFKNFVKFNLTGDLKDKEKIFADIDAAKVIINYFDGTEHTFLELSPESSVFIEYPQKRYSLGEMRTLATETTAIDDFIQR